MTTRSLDQKLARIHADPHGARDFILADAKDADMALGIAAPGPAHPGRFPHRSLAAYRDQIRAVVRQGLVDIMLMSASTAELLAGDEQLFAHSTVTPALRANDATDVHIYRGGRVHLDPALPFRTARLPLPPIDLGLYSITFNNEARLDRETLAAYRDFRAEARLTGFRHFLEVFDPNVPGAVDLEQVPGFVNDAIVRTLAGVVQAERPIFLKMVYHGPAALEELVHYDPHLIVGILGGSAGTTYDAFKLLTEARRYGARAALFGRKINQAEHQLAFIQLLRLLADGELTAEEAVRAYHGVLQKLKIEPRRSLAEDMQLTSGLMNYGGTKTISIPAKPADCRCRHEAPPQDGASCGGAGKAAPTHWPTRPDGEPDFARMTAAQKIAWNQQRWRRLLG
jgi:hypothetical protein